MSSKVSSRPSNNKEALTQKQNSVNRVAVITKSADTHGRRESKCNQVSCIPSINKNKIIKRNCINRIAVNKRSAEGCGIRLPKRSEFSPVRFLKHLGSKMARGLCFAYFKKRRSATVSSSGRSKPSVIPVDSHRTEAIEDCIEFINSSSSLPRSNSVSANTTT